MTEVKIEAESVAYEELHGCMIRRSGDTCEVRKEFLAVALKALSLQDELVEALEGLEAANNLLCSQRTSQQYVEMLDLGQQDALEKLDAARQSARSLLTRIKSERDEA